jgi:transcriptional regulator with XRE-family HTH domain
MFNANFGERLKEERKRLKITQEKLAEAGGVTKRTIIYYEQNKISPPDDFLNKINENVPGIDVTYIYTGVKKEVFNQLHAGELNIHQISDLIDELEDDYDDSDLDYDRMREVKAEISTGLLNHDEFKLLRAYKYASQEQKAMFDTLALLIPEPKKTR